MKIKNIVIIFLISLSVILNILLINKTFEYRNELNSEPHKTFTSLNEDDVLTLNDNEYIFQNDSGVILNISGKNEYILKEGEYTIIKLHEFKNTYELILLTVK